MSDRTCRRILEKAKQRGYCPEEDPRILDHYVIDGARLGRPREIDRMIEEALLELIVADRSGREKSSEVLAYESSISSSLALRILHRNYLNSIKLTRKSSLNIA